MKKKFQTCIKKITALLLTVILFSGILPQAADAGVILTWPVPGHTNLSQGFHDQKAIDISDGNIAGAPVVAAYGGTVSSIFLCGIQHEGSDHNCNGFGTGIVITGDDGRFYQYAHMQANSVPANVYRGAYVSAGQQIGKVGTTGNSSGNHLHFGISLGNYWNNSGINPLNETYGSAAPSITFTDSACTPSEYSAHISTKATATSRGTFTEAGIYIYDIAGNLVANKTESVNTTGSYLNIWYDVKEEVGVELKPGTQYQYEIYTVFNGQRYTEERKTFQTTGVAKKIVVKSEIIEGKEGAIYVKGFAYDEANPSKQLKLRVYDGNYPLCEVTANKERRDIDETYHVGAYHGYEETIPMDVIGKHTISIYLIKDNGSLGYLAKVSEIEVSAPKPVVPEKKVEDIFVDIHEGDWFLHSAQYVYNNALMTGLDDTHWGPMQNLARAQFAMILYRMEGNPEVEFEPMFPDVKEGDWYAKAVTWAYKNKIITGYTDTKTFGPSDHITREQMAVMMHRYLTEYKQVTITPKGDLSSFADGGSVNEFAKEAMKWCIGESIITGDGVTGKLLPQGNTNRAVCATIMERFIKKYA